MSRMIRWILLRESVEDEDELVMVVIDACLFIPVRGHVFSTTSLERVMFRSSRVSSRSSRNPSCLYQLCRTVMK